MNNGNHMNVEEVEEVEEVKEESIAQRVKARSDRRTVVIPRVEEVLGKVMRFLKENPLFIGHTVQITRHELLPNGYSFVLSLNDDTYVKLFLEYEHFHYPVKNGRIGEKGEEIDAVSASVPSVYSSLGKGTGLFLLHLAMAIAVASGAVQIQLDNDADEPVRAVQGIYQLFSADLRSTNLRFVTEESKMKQAERVHVVGRNSLEMIHNVVVDKVAKEVSAGGGGIWRTDAVENVHRLFRQNSPAWSGGSRSRSGSSKRKKTVRWGKGKGKGKGTRKSKGKERNEKGQRNEKGLRRSAGLKRTRLFFL